MENFKRRRQTELKHGRISMLATMGYITPEITGKFPGYLSPSAGLKFADVPNGLAAISKVPAAGWGQILAYMAFCEVSQDQSPGTPAAAGDFGFKVLTSSDPEEKTKKLSAELANGRLAMMAIIGMFFQDIQTSQTRLSLSKLGRFASLGIAHGDSVLRVADGLTHRNDCGKDRLTANVFINANVLISVACFSTSRNKNMRTVLRIHSCAYSTSCPCRMA